MSNPNVHLFRTSQMPYLYDVNTDTILPISERQFHEAKADKSLSSPLFQTMREAGFLKENRVEEAEHPGTPYLGFYLDHKINQMILQVTQSCNLRCEYCIYSGAYHTRSHSQKQMTTEIAHRAIDFLISHSADSEEVFLSFYGGEPLLRVDLIQDCIEYFRKAGRGKKVSYNLTTNGTLLTDEIADLLVANEISVMFSLDGPEPIHDYHRKYAKDGKGSFETLKKNVIRLRERYPDYFAKHVNFNTVLDQRRDFSCVDDFVSGEDWLQGVIFSSSVIANDYGEDYIEPSAEFIQEREYEYFKILLAALGKGDKEHLSKLELGRWKSFVQSLRTDHFGRGKGELPRKAHHGGPCVPGALRTFVTADGYFYPCERVSETSELTGIGSVFTGYDQKKIEDIINIGRESAAQCRECWAFRYCGICIRAVDGGTTISKESQVEHCRQTRSYVESMFKDYCVLHDLGYDLWREESGL